MSESARSVEGTAAQVYGGPTHKVAFYRFMTALEEDVVVTGAMLGRMGYALSECYIEETVDLRIFKLDRFRVELSAFKDESYDPFESETTNEEFDERVAQVLKGDPRFCALEARVYLVSSDGEGGDILLAGEHVYGVELPEGGAFAAPVARSSTKLSVLLVGTSTRCP